MQDKKTYNLNSTRFLFNGVAVEEKYFKFQTDDSLILTQYTTEQRLKQAKQKDYILLKNWKLK